MLSFLLNILWIIFGGGLVLCLEYLLAGCLLCLTIVGIPFGIQCFKIAGLALLPFGKDIGPLPAVSASEPLRLVFNVIWAIVAGICIFLNPLVLGTGSTVTLSGLLFAPQHLSTACP